jgi:hypothetical protein
MKHSSSRSSRQNTTRAQLDLVTHIRACGKRILALALLAVALLWAPAASGATPEQADCTRKSGEFTPGRKIDPPITLTPDAATQTVNFGGGRGYQFADVVVKASAPLPASVKPQDLDIEVQRRIVRQSDTLTTVSTNPPTFTQPRLNPRRDVIIFTVCFNGARLQAGHYTGAITVEGPPGVGPTNIAFNVNAKDLTLALVLLIVGGFLVLALIIWRGATTVQGEQAKKVAGAVNDAAEPDTEKATVDKNAMDVAKTTVKSRARVGLLKPKGGEALRDPTFWIGTVVAILGGLAAAWAVYSGNTAWGADPITDGIALVSALLAAAGLRSVVATAAGK